MPTNGNRVIVALISVLVIWLLCTPLLVNGDISNKSSRYSEVRGVQSTNCIISKRNQENGPFEIVGIFVGANQVRFNESFIYSDNWLENLRIKMKNVSGKIVNAVIVEIKIPRKELGLTTLNLPLQLGAPTLKPNTNANLWIKPGEVVELTMMDRPGVYDALIGKLHVESPSFRLNKVIIDLAYVMFDDDTIWRLGVILNRDRNNPTRFIKPGTVKPPTSSTPKEKSKLPQALSTENSSLGLFFKPAIPPLAGQSFASLSPISANKNNIPTKSVRACGDFDGFSTWDCDGADESVRCFLIDEWEDESGSGPYDADTEEQLCLTDLVEQCDCDSYYCWSWDTVLRIVDC